MLPKSLMASHTSNVSILVIFLALNASEKKLCDACHTNNNHRGWNYTFR